MSRSSRWWLAVGAGVLLAGPGAWHLARLALEERRMDRQLAEVEQSRAQLAAEADRLQHDDIYVESLIRSTFKVSRPGEYVLPLTHEPPPLPLLAGDSSETRRDAPAP